MSIKKIHILTSTRADFNFFIPLLQSFKNASIPYTVVAFGTHLSHKHGYTINEVKKEVKKELIEIDTYIEASTPNEINKAISICIDKFSNYWNQCDADKDILLGLGDRYELFAAIIAAKTYNLQFIHLSGGEETFGAIDNIYRHCLSLMATLHFTNTKENAVRVKQLTNNEDAVIHSGSLTIDNILATPVYNLQEFNAAFNLQLEQPFILTTFHPETVNYKANTVYINELIEAINNLAYTFLITMPNADLGNFEVREALQQTAEKNQRVILVESLGHKGYYSALALCYCVLGNSSSGIVEAASFGKYAINIGERQAGRERGINVIDIAIDKKRIIDAIKSIQELPSIDKSNIYGNGGAAQIITDKIKSVYFEKL